MTTFARWTPALVLAVVASSSFLSWAENRSLMTVIAVAVVGLGVLLIWRRSGVSSRTWTVVAVACVAAALTLLFLHVTRIADCTAVDASGARRVIGRDLQPGVDKNATLPDLGDDPIENMWTPRSIEWCRDALLVTGAFWIPLLGVAALAGAKAVQATSGAVTVPVKQQIFISYNHADAAEARRLCRYLQDKGERVVIDAENMHPGERISGFIERSVRESDVVVSLVSNRSLLSAWVAVETIQTLSRNKWVCDRICIFCYVDDEFLRPEFHLEATRKIDERLQAIERLIPEHAEHRIDTLDLNEEKTRLYDLRNNLGTILATIRDSRCLDARPEKLEESGQHIVAAVHELRRQRS
jgi:hypothetical protein